jgi:hypothetical protein
MTKCTIIKITTSILAILLANSSTAFAEVGTVGTSCGDGPKANEAYIYSGLKYTGTCQVVYYTQFRTNSLPHYDFNFAQKTCFDASVSGLMNDAIKSVKVGSQIILYFFNNTFDFQENTHPMILQASSSQENLGDWNNKISAIRAIDATMYNSICTQNTYGMVAVFQDVAEQGDCVLLPYGVQNSGAKQMCFHNDTMSSYHSYAPSTVYFYTDSNKGGQGYSIAPGSVGNFVWNDMISSGPYGQY